MPERHHVQARRGRARRQPSKSQQAARREPVLGITRATRPDDLPEFLRVEEVAAWLDVSPGAVYELIASKALACIRLGARDGDYPEGRLIRVPKSAMFAFTAKAS